MKTEIVPFDQQTDGRRWVKLVEKINRLTAKAHVIELSMSKTNWSVNYPNNPVGGIFPF
ncbi:MAG: hypothetical protein IPL32_17300 [Chloracidobacterium sp.]|nr:hypothetical protein [Chloracidobacterium sp.]